MDIFISSDNRQSFFIDNILEVIREKNEISQRLGIDIRPIYPPRNLGCDSQDIIRRILQIKDASLVFMNLTPIEVVDTEYSLNSGVCVEYGIILSIGRRAKCHPFCNIDYRRRNLSPVFQGNIDIFSEDDSDGFKDTIGGYIDTYLERSTSEFEKYVLSSGSTDPR